MAALAPNGVIETVVDWKSDVAPVVQTVDGYWSKVHAYIRVIEAARGPIVLMTSATMLEAVK